MNDKDLEKINTVDITVTSESMDAHVICLRENGYKVFKKSSAYIRYLLFFLLGAYSIGVILQLKKLET